ncbi:MAG: DUF4810 domain-containing protein [Bacteroidales bacterium]|jgi:hypothetical protein|nr:DUF4810 domain-containing protein [Bacteroidales bacterium]
MKKLFVTIVAAFMLFSCGQKPLYDYRNYDNTTYSYLKKNDEKADQNLAETYESIIEKPRGERNTVPPGIYADYGYLLLQLDQTEKGKKMLAREIELYPESKIFIDRILKKLEE